VTNRICAKTGLSLTDSPVSAVRIARQSLGSFNPRLRDGGEDVRGWSRFDTLGRTIYASDDKLTAYLELLSPYRTEIDAHRRALQKDADYLGIPLEELWKQVVAEWDEAGNMKARWLPRAFREGRAMYEISFPQGWWVDLTTAESLQAIGENFPDGLPTLAGTNAESLTISDVTGDDRVLTTTLATWLRESVTLDDGSLVTGVRFHSKHGRPSDGSGICWAYWMRQADHGLVEPATVLNISAIEPDDVHLKKAQQHCKVTTR
jgi:hypothetical protein